MRIIWRNEAAPNDPYGNSLDPPYGICIEITRTQTRGEYFDIWFAAVPATPAYKPNVAYKPNDD